MRWEYKTVKLGVVGALGVAFDEKETNAFLNKMGSVGWELISTLDLNEDHGNSLFVIMIFKRPLNAGSNE